MTQNLSYEIKVTAFEKILERRISPISAMKAIANEQIEIFPHVAGQELIKVSDGLFAACSAHLSYNEFPIVRIKDYCSR